MKIAILFTHHNSDDVTCFNFNRLKQFNPDKDIYSLGFKNMNLLPKSFIVDEDQEYLPKNFIFNTSTHGKAWTESDLLIYDFIYHNDLPHDKYLIIEWDTYCNCSIEEFYGDALNKETFGHTVHNSIEENWKWYTDLSQKQKDSLPVFGGYTPTSGLLISKKILTKINEIILKNPRMYDDMNSELRLGSLIKAAGYSLDIPFEKAEDFINWEISRIIFDKTKNGYYHPIKTIIN